MNGRREGEKFGDVVEKDTEESIWDLSFSKRKRIKGAIYDSPEMRLMGSDEIVLCVQDGLCCARVKMVVEIGRAHV